MALPSYFNALVVACLLIICSSVEAENPYLREGYSSDSYDSHDSSESYDSHDSYDDGKDKKDETCEIVTALSPEEFDLDTYIRRTWFVQRQQVNPYQGEDDLYCVCATYNKNRLDGRVQVLNFGRTGAVDAPEQNPNPDGFFNGICAEQLWGGRLRVGPCILGTLSCIAYGPYFVVAVGIDEVANDYSWSIISAGQPDEFRERKDGRNFCTTTNSTSFFNINGAGLWFFTRERVASEETLAEMEEALYDLGIFAGDLRDVAQEGCTYPDFIKL